MESFLIMKNNLHRRFTSWKTYLVLFLIPVAVLILSTLQYDLRTDQVMIGVENCNDVKKLKGYEQWKKNHVILKQAEEKSKYTDLITKRYDLIIEAEGDHFTAESEEEMNAFFQEAEQGTESASRVKIAIAMLMMIDMIAASIYCVTLIRDRKSGLMERVKCCGIRGKSYVWGMAEAVALIIGLQAVVSMILLNVMEPELRQNLLKSILYILAITISSAVFGVVIALVHKKELHASLTASGIVAILYLLSGSLLPVEQMPQVLQIISILNPIRWLLQI